ncbi:MAG: hypothetical protein NVS9B14_05770 [Candidatus Acidiferrum sp.]
MKGDVERELWIVDEIADDCIVFAEDAVVGDEAKDFIGEIGHRCEGLDFLIGKSRRLQYSALDDFVRVANEGAAGFGAAFDGELHALGDGHFGYLLKKGLTALNIGFGLGSGFGKVRFVGGTAVHFVKKILLVRSDGGRALKSRGECERVADTPKVFEQSLNAHGREVLNDRNEEGSRAIFILNERLADAGLICEIFGSVGKQGGQSFRPFDSVDKSFWGNREKRFLRTRGNHFVGIVRKDRQHFDAIYRVHVRTGCTHGQFAFARCATVAKIVYNFRAEMLHRLPV